MMAGVSMFYLGYPVVRCVSKFPDFIYRDAANSYVFLEAKATTTKSLDQEINSFFRTGMTELVAKVCNEAAIVTTVIEDLFPLTVRTEITKIAFASSLNTRTESMKQSIFREIKDVLMEELLFDPNRNVNEALTDILRGDAEFAGELARKFEEEIFSELEKARSRLCGNRTTQDSVETSEHSENQAVTNLPEFYPPCPAGSSPAGHLIKELNGKRYLIAGRGLIQL